MKRSLRELARDADGRREHTRLRVAGELWADAARSGRQAVTAWRRGAEFEPGTFAFCVIEVALEEAAASGTPVEFL